MEVKLYADKMHLYFRQQNATSIPWELEQVKCLPSKRINIRLKYNRTVNTSGKAHSNYPKDLDVEHNNKILVSEFNALYRRLTDRTLHRNQLNLND